jgi:hypothetical protein
VSVLVNGPVEPLFLIKEVPGPDCGSESCEDLGGSSCQPGFVPDPEHPAGIQNVASPDPRDASFFAKSDHAWHARNFALRVVRMRPASHLRGHGSERQTEST